jgi:hypothetical protein
MNIKDMIKDKKVTFMYYTENELWYTTECGFEFPVPISDVGTANMMAQDKAILFMRWIRKHIDVVEGHQREKSEFQQEWDYNNTLAHCATPFERIPEAKK